MNPIVLEATLYIAMVLSIPALWWIFSTLGEILGKILFPGKIIEITHTDDEGRVVTSRCALDDDDELVRALLRVKGEVKF